MSFRLSTRSLVFALSGAVVGTTLITATVPDELVAGWATEATPEVPARVFCAEVRKSWVCCWDPEGSFSTTVRGPLVPSPNPCVIRS